MYIIYIKYIYMHPKLDTYATMPLHVSKSTNFKGMTDLHYIYFEAAVTHPFTAEQQPFL
jgi:hypothetical protein